LLFCAAGLKNEVGSLLQTAQAALEAEDWDAGRESCRKALRLAVQAGTTKELNELEKLEKLLWKGEARSQERKEGDELVQKAKVALGSGDLNEAREALSDAKGAFKRAAWEQGMQEVQAMLVLVEATEKRATLRQEARKLLVQGQVYLSVCIPQNTVALLNQCLPNRIC
jgi:hypothetical protein